MLYFTTADIYLNTEMSLVQGRVGVLDKLWAIIKGCLCKQSPFLFSVGIKLYSFKRTSNAACKLGVEWIKESFFKTES